MPKNIFNSLKRYVDRAKSNARSAVIRASYVDTRSDTTRKGYHEGRTRYGYNYGANENGITGTIARVIDGKDHNPYLQTGIAPMPDKIASPKDISRIYKVLKKGASKITPKQWTALQDAAIARGDMAEAQRLRDLHFKVSAPKTKAIKPDGQPLALYHGTGKKFNYFDDNKIGTNYLDLGYYGRGHYFTPFKDAAEGYASVNNTPVVYKVYGNFKNPKVMSLEDESMIGKTIKNNDSVIAGMDDIDYSEYVSKTGKQLKSADAVTYDDNGVRIPLGDRDNFNINDIRWSWLLPVFGVGAATAVNAKDKNKSKFKLGGNLSIF